ncbi:hypothetical protein EOD39_1478 [Acipenser ruthenus]|uniref:Uncharacterized protein n=1 Tax=Acipenser ruthenus TaxID=7906 RepID=A0A444UB91_ACIRT|nr:hypothetical protein EOD39_1478 [Acipenser ruthenus]
MKSAKDARMMDHLDYWSPDLPRWWMGGLRGPRLVLCLRGVRTQRGALSPPEPRKQKCRRGGRSRRQAKELVPAPVSEREILPARVSEREDLPVLVPEREVLPLLETPARYTGERKAGRGFWDAVCHICGEHGHYVVYGRKYGWMPSGSGWN